MKASIQEIYRADLLVVWPLQLLGHQLLRDTPQCQQFWVGRNPKNSRTKHLDLLLQGSHIVTEVFWFFNETKGQNCQELILFKNKSVMVYNTEIKCSISGSKAAELVVILTMEWRRDRWGRGCLDETSTNGMSTEHFYPHGTSTKQNVHLDTSSFGQFDTHSQRPPTLRPPPLQGGRYVTCNIMSTLCCVVCDILSPPQSWLSGSVGVSQVTWRSSGWTTCHL